MKGSVRKNQNGSNNMNPAVLTIHSTANLDITMILESTPKKRSPRYRPVERPDGVIVLHRPYQPASSVIQQRPKFEKNIPIFEPRDTKSKAKGRAMAPNKVETGLKCVGAQFATCGRDGYNGPVTTGRKRYHSPASICEDEGCSPMYRFLDEAGPWSSLALRGNP